MAHSDSDSDRAQRYLDIAGVMIVALDRHGNVTLANRKAREILGWTEAELLGRSWFEVALPERLRPRVRTVFERLISGELEPVERFENPVLTRSGEERTIAWHNTLLRDESGGITGSLSSGEDITERIRREEERFELERQILQAQKLESLGVLAGGIAHDFNNILMGVLGNADLALSVLSPASPARENVRRIITAAQRAAELSQQMLAYSGKGRFVVETIDLNEVIREMSHLVEVSLSKKAALKFSLADNLPATEGDVTQIRQVIMNLITNASEAIGDRSGIISVVTGAQYCGAEYLARVFQMSEPEEGVFVVLEVADTGTGMDEETRERIFDPFFSTKFAGRGLGLAAVLGIVRGHGGAIRVYSEPSKGSTFKLLFPAAHIDPDVVASARAGAGRWTGKGTILLVDDESTVLAVGKQMLASLGFDALLAEDGQEALELFRAHGDEISFVILDLTMPRMDGEQTFRALREINPEVAVIITSGYHEAEVVSRFSGKGLAGFLQKPYTLGQLSSRLREAAPSG